MSAVRLRASDVTFGYDPAAPVVHGVSLEVSAGEVVFLLGHNGSGKTSLLGCLNGVLRADRGRVTIDDVDVYALAPAARATRIGMIPQTHAATFGYDVLDVVLTGRAPHLPTFGVPSRADRAIALEALDRVGLAGFAGRRYTAMSGGERQLVMVARGLAQRCDVLLMDEPDAHLDPRNQFRVLEVVSDLAREAQLSFVVSSHAPNAALMFADRVVLLRHGRTLASGRPGETLTEPLLSEAYGMPTEVVTKVVDGRRTPRAILPRRIDRVPEGVTSYALDADGLARPERVVAPLLERAGERAARVIVTGARGSGKSRWCERLVEHGRGLGWRVVAALSPAVFEADHKVGIDLVLLPGGERRRLADVRRGPGEGPTTERWRFDEATLRWASDGLAAAAEAPFDLFVLDEVGPLELQRDGGLVGGLRVVDEARQGVACVVVRPSLLAAALRRWPDALVLDVED